MVQELEEKTDVSEADDKKAVNMDEQVANRMERLNLFFEKENVRKHLTFCHFFF